MNIVDNVWQFEVNWCVNEWQFLTVMGSFGLAADNKRTPVRSLKYNFLQIAATWWSLGDNFWQLCSLEVSLGDNLWRLEFNWLNSDDRCENSRSNWGVIVRQFITVIGSSGMAADSLWKLKFNWGSQLLTICYLKRSLCILLSDNWCNLKVSCRPLYDNSRQLVVPLGSLGDSLWP